mmetsp:Transcript_8404/g.13642  ORF Transcript_8404/g.13642 Transcript_8404/m.13642 type:complete len:81 (-) Transcript_8404:45-287(-)
MNHCPAASAEMKRHDQRRIARCPWTVFEDSLSPEARGLGRYHHHVVLAATKGQHLQSRPECPVACCAGVRQEGLGASVAR